MAPLTTPEEAKAFLATMREAQHKRERSHQPPSNLSADGMDAWFLRQRKEEQELRNRRREAETILRNYRSGNQNGNNNNGNSRASWDNKSSSTPRHSYAGSEHGNDTPTDPNDDTESHIAADYTGTTAALFATQPKTTKGPSSLPDQEEKKESMEPSSPSQRRFGGTTHPSLSAVPLSVESTPPLTTPAAAVEETIWRDFVSSAPGAKFPPQAGRYHLYCSYACPGSHRALIVRALKGLQSVISVTYVHPVWRLTKPHDPNDKHRGWVFGRPGGDPFANTIHKGGPFPAAYSDNEPDPHHPTAFSIRDLYQEAHDTSGKYTIPLLWDTKLQTIVNNESSDIAYMFNSCFNNLAENPHVDLYTEDDAIERAKLSQVSDWLSPLMIHGVYRCGFAKSQWAYDRAINELCAAFDRADDILERQRYLTGNDCLTDVDIRLFVTLLRFDEVYTVYFKANARLVLLTPSLLNFCRDMYQMPGVAATCNMEQIKAHFFASHAEWNKYSVIPRGLGFMELLDMPHDRDSFVSTNNHSAPNALTVLAALPPSTTTMGDRPAEEYPASPPQNNDTPLSSTHRKVSSFGDSKPLFS